jgi:hypothetical protein
MRTESLDFYSTAAQIMPVLFIALVLQAVRHGERPVRTSLVIIVVTAILCEVVALKVLADGDPSVLTARIIGECLWITGLTLALRILLNAFEEVAANGARDDTNAIAIGGAVLLLIGMILIAIL